MNSQNVIWKTDINDAVTASAEKRKPLLIFFTSQGVSPQLQNEIFSTRDFEEWSHKNVILVKLDLSDPSISDAAREQNLRLKNAFGIEEIPQVCFSEVTSRKGKTNFNSLLVLINMISFSLTFTFENPMFLASSEIVSVSCNISN